MAAIKWYGHAAFRLDFGVRSVLIDPFISQNPSCPVSIYDVEKADIILVTHEHTDHLGDGIELAKKFEAHFVAIYEITSKASVMGVKKTMGMNIGGTAEVDGVEITMVPALHSGLPVGFVVKYKDLRIYHAGDTGLFSDMKLISELYGPIDIALLPIGGHYTMGPKEAAIAASWIKPKVVIPMHYNTFALIKQDPEAFAKMVKEREPSIEVKVLKPGEVFNYP
ncbi:MAG: metal-dependent hydrolase [Candidatus Methanomethylicota archaeon]|uniref:UPF0173 metal-dependent hydrolase DRJ31_00415 n=1 Tax=Thermoproteota archaeon TaxID=2056631 RepID=A0A497EVA2_9CREN|nr:MAG: metal-dependent hydrolase [Candidatus Verstraetearchaeota archaeon]RLE51159.1 MAG: metal-dependent hydrolase [Candidatus Verstraetearchaeota archaeon]